MSAEAVAETVVAGITRDEEDFILANFANADMVGHTGKWAATVQALEFLDECIGRIADAAAALDARRPDGSGSLLVITADHGNADELRTPAGDPVTAHSLNAVPIVVAGRAVDGRRLHDGVLADVAPTILELAGLPAWPEMTGRSLLD
jgi:2,3-bisphosphoglycerate-independent phosphoglycerate mutase